jgi:DNA polymerase III delta prime subunit
MIEDFIWYEKYRPTSLSDCILPDRIRGYFTDLVKGENLPHLMFTGPAGIGKTTLAKAICDDMNIDTYFINGSMNGGIDTLRNEVLNFASSVSFSGNRKCVIIDEADNLSMDTMKAARGFMEEFAKNCTFILTCNYPKKIIEPIHSRCTVIDFTLSKKEVQEVAPKFLKRLSMILDTEGVTYDKPVLAELIKKYYPDWRKVIDKLQEYSVNGVIDTGILANTTESLIQELVNYLKNKEFTNMRKWVEENSDISVNELITIFYSTASKYMTKDSIPPFILLLNKCQVQHSMVANPSVNLAAIFVEVMVEVTWL